MLGRRFLKTISVKSNVQPYHVCKSKFAFLTEITESLQHWSYTEQG